MTEILLDRPVLTEPGTTTESGRVSHIVWVPTEVAMSAAAYVLEAMIEGTEVQALCGHRWVPSRDPQALPVCQRCVDIYQQSSDGSEGRDDLPDP